MDKLRYRLRSLGRTYPSCRKLSSNHLLNKEKLDDDVMANIASLTTRKTRTADLVKKAQCQVENDMPILQRFLLKAPRFDFVNKIKELGKFGKVFETFGIRSELLPLSKPPKVKETPFQFHSLHNENQSYISVPRLSVTKLLTDQWCELREYYNIYAGSPAVKSKQMSMGTNLHAGLEEDQYRFVDFTSFVLFVGKIFLEKLLALREDLDIKAEILAGESDALTTYSLYESLLLGNTKESEMANEWLDKIVFRLYTLLLTSEAREVLVHGYLDMQKHTFINIANENSNVAENLILVSGVVDYLKIFNRTDPRDYSFFDDVRSNLEVKYPEVDGTQFIDLTNFLEDLKLLICEHADQFTLKVADIKTRSWNRIPSQASVLRSSKLQVTYYRHLLGLLSGETTDGFNAYQMLIENAKRRGIDVDKPINLKFALLFLRRNYDLLYCDFKKLANGDPIGFDPYDDFMSENYNSQDLWYDFSLITDELTNVNELSKIDPDNFDYLKILSPELSKSWKYPLTLRYFAARASQLYQSCAPFLGDNLSIEYHNALTHKCFSKIDFKYDKESLDSSINNAVSFWNGSRNPSVVEDISKCKYCNFSSVCQIPNPEKSHLAGKMTEGRAISDFLSTLD